LRSHFSYLSLRQYGLYSYFRTFLNAYSLNTILLVLALLCFFGLYEIYPRPGWVDGSMYIGYAINPEIYKIYTFETHNYQGSRLGYVLPQHFLFRIFGDINGRELYVLILYLAYFFSVTILTGFFIKKNVERVLLCVLFIFNPVFVSSIFYGGADGPAPVQLLVAISFLVCATRSISQFRRNLLSFFSGFFLMLSISSHIFAFIPALLIVPTLLYVFKAKKLAAPMIFGGLTAISICNFYGYQFGLDRFYFLYSLPFAKASFSHGIGELMAKPLTNVIKDSIFWLPVILSILLFFFFNRNLSSREGKPFPLLAVSLLNLIGPVTIFTFFDVFTGGNTLNFPAYFNIVYPSFLVGLVLMISLNTETMGKNNVITRSKAYQTKVALIFLVCISLILAFTAEWAKSSLLWNSIKSSDLYRSEVSFLGRIKSEGLNTGKLQFIYTTIGPEGKHDLRVYKDFYGGSQRYFDYLDSLTSLFLWDRSIALRLEPDVDLKKINLKLKEDIPIIFLGRSKAEIRRLVVPLSRFLVGHTAGPYECFDDNSYPWCFIEFKNTGRIDV